MSDGAPTLPADLTSPDPALRRRALLSLAGRPPNRAHLEVFRQLASADPEAPLRLLARQLHQETSAQLEASEAGPSGLDISTGHLDLTGLRSVLDTGDTDAKIDAVRKAVETRDASAVGILREHLPRESDGWVLASLLKAVGTLGDSQDIHLIQPFLKNDDLRIQANAIEALELIGDELSFSLVAPHLQSADARIRANAIKCLVRFDPEEALDTLERMAQSDKAGSRESAVYCMGIVAHDRIAGIIAAMVPEESEPELLAKQLMLLSEEGGVESVGPLAFLVETLDGSLQEQAALALGRVRGRVQIGDDEMRRARLAVESAQQANRKNPRALAELPQPISAGVSGGSAEDAENEVKEYLAKKRRAARKAPAPPEGAGQQVLQFFRENPSFVALAGVTGLFLTASLVLFFMPAEPDQVAAAPTRAPIRRPIQRAEKDKDDDETKPNQAVTLQCTVNNIDRKRKSALLKHDGKILSVTLESTPPDGIQRNAAVEVRGYFTGKVRFGAREFVASDLRKL